MYRIFGPFSFGAAGKMEDALARAEEWPKVLYCDCSWLPRWMPRAGMPGKMWSNVCARGGTVVPSGIHQQPLQSLKQSGFLKVMGRENVCATFDDALVQARKVLESEKGPSR